MQYNIPARKENEVNVEEDVSWDLRSCTVWDINTKSETHLNSHCLFSHRQTPSRWKSGLIGVRGEGEIHWLSAVTPLFLSDCFTAIFELRVESTTHHHSYSSRNSSLSGHRMCASAPLSVFNTLGIYRSWIVKLPLILVEILSLDSTRLSYFVNNVVIL